MSDVAGYNLTERKWVWRLRVRTTVWGGGCREGLSYLFIMKGWQLMKRSVEPSFALHRLIVTHTLQERLGPLCCDTRQSGEDGIEMRSKKKERERNERATEEQISGLKDRRRGREVWLRRRGAGGWNEKIEGGDGWERRGGETAASSTRLMHSSYLSVRQQAGGRVDRQETKTTLIPAASCWCQS